MSEKLWDTFVPDRKLSFTSPGFWVLLGLVVVLHTYNEYRDRTKAESDEDMQAEARRREAADAKRRERQGEMGNGQPQGR